MGWRRMTPRTRSTSRWPRDSSSSGACPASGRRTATSGSPGAPVPEPTQTPGAPVPEPTETPAGVGSAPMRLWGGRFAAGPAEALARLSVSVQFDWRLAPYDLLASRAHARVLHQAGLLDHDELARMLSALDDLDTAAANGSFRPTIEDEDVHTALERGLLERLGTLGGKLRAGRSRNDQVATDLRLYLRDQVRRIAERLAELEEALLGQAERHLDTAAPGMTHLQHAQPVLFAHQLLAHVQAVARDVDRLIDWDRRAAVPVDQPIDVAGNGLHVRQQLVGEQHRLRVLQVGHPRRRGVEVALGLAQQRLLQLGQPLGDPPDLVAQVEPQVGGHLVVAAATCPQLAAQGAESLQETALQGGVHVLVLDRRPKRPVRRRGVQVVERGQHPGQLVVVEQAGLVQHLSLI